MTTHGGIRARRWLGAWLLLLIALGVAAATGYGITRVHDYAAERGELKALLSGIETAAHQQSAGVAGGGRGPAVARACAGAARGR